LHCQARESCLTSTLSDEIYVNGVHETMAIGTTHPPGYGVRGDNLVTVVAIDEAGNKSIAGETTLFTPF